MQNENNKDTKALDGTEEDQNYFTSGQAGTNRSPKTAESEPVDDSLENSRTGSEQSRPVHPGSGSGGFAGQDYELGRQGHSKPTFNQFENDGGGGYAGEKTFGNNGTGNLDAHVNWNDSLPAEDNKKEE